MLTPKKTVLNAKGYGSSLYGEEYLMKLDLNENIIGPSPRVLEALKDISARDIQFYPVYGELIETIARHNNVDMSMVLPTNGADEAISYIFNTFVESDDTVLTVEPTFAMPKVYANSTGCKYKEISYSKKWQFPLDEFLSQIDDGVKLIIITTPNSPTGESIKREDLFKILDKAKNSYVLIDETYSNYSEQSYTDLLKEYKNVLVAKSMSKDFAIAGLRLGYIISCAENIDYIKRIMSPFSVNVLAAKAGVAAIADVEYFEGVKSQVRESKQILIDGLKGLAKKVYPSDANFLCIDWGSRAEFIYKKLLKAGIKAKFYDDGSMLQNHFRMAVPAPSQAKQILDVLAPRDLIVFDIDGVLIDTRQSYRLAIKGTYEHFAGQEIEPSAIQRAKNLGGLNNDWDLTEYLLNQSGLDIPKQDIIDKFQELYFGDDGSGFIKNEELLVPKEMLEQLASQYDLAVFTGRPRKEALFALESRGLDGLFAPIVSMDDLPMDRQKPDSLGLDKIIDITQPMEVYYLGDTADDMIAAVKAKATVKGIGVLPPQDKSDELKDSLYEKGAVGVLYKTEEILEYLELGACAYEKK